MNTATAPFTAHSQVVPLRGIFAPRPVTVMPAKLSVNPACREAIDAFADEMLRQERQRRADEASELITEAQRLPAVVNPQDD